LKGKAGKIGVKDKESQTPLFRAMKQGHVVVVHQLLSACISPDNALHKEDLRTLLLWAVKGGHGHNKVIWLILKEHRSFGIELQHEDIHAALRRAVQHDYKDAIELVVLDPWLCAYVDAQASGHALAWAIGKCHENIVQLLLRRNKININWRGQSGSTPLLLAAHHGYKGIVQILLNEIAADVNARDNHGSTPLSRAAENGHKDIVQLLLETKKANVNLMGDLSWAKPLALAAANGHRDVVQMLLHTHNINVHASRSYGSTALLNAVKRGHKEIVRLLLQFEKADASIYDASGDSALSWAVKNDCKDMVELILETGRADVNQKDHEGRTLLH
jgi:ankyrin repeat protein